MEKVQNVGTKSAFTPSIFKKATKKLSMILSHDSEFLTVIKWRANINYIVY